MPPTSTSASILVNCQSISKSYSSRPLFRDLAISVNENEKVGLIGPNGAGKSTLLKIMAGLVEPDGGDVVRRRKLRVAYVPQDEKFPGDKTVEQIVTESAEKAEFLDHEREASVDSTLSKLDFPDRNAKTSALSGGWRKRLSVACALVQKPELLLLDEPTNHLDLDGVLWLESFLKSTDTSFVVITHDRAFLENISNRMVELNPAYPQGFLSNKGNYSSFLEAREELVASQVNLQQALASQVRREIAWLKQGAKARQMKARGRIQDAAKLMEEFAEVKQRNSLNTSIEVGFDASGRKTKELLVLKGVKKAFGDNRLFDNLSFVLTPGTRLGLVGRNGSGKTTLLKLIMGLIEPDSGTIKPAPDLKVIWFDQSREQLDQTKSLKESLVPFGDSVVYRGRSMHAATWSRKFLFKPDQLNLPISYLSGGEQARILIANLMLQTADVLILDEPTNDLDIASLEVLQESLEEFPGAVVLVSHDRMLLDSVSNHVLLLCGSGRTEFFADYEQCEQTFVALGKATAAAAGTEIEKSDRKEQKSRGRGRTDLSTAEKRELTNMPEKIEQAENKIASLQSEMEKPQIASNYTRLQELEHEKEALRKQLETLFTRWEELEAKAAAAREENIG